MWKNKNNYQCYNIQMYFKSQMNPAKKEGVRTPNTSLHSIASGYVIDTYRRYSVPDDVIYQRVCHWFYNRSSCFLVWFSWFSSQNDTSFFKILVIDHSDWNYVSNIWWSNTYNKTSIIKKHKLKINYWWLKLTYDKKTSK